MLGKPFNLDEARGFQMALRAMARAGTIREHTGWPQGCKHQKVSTFEAQRMAGRLIREEAEALECELITQYHAAAPFLNG